MKAFKLQQKIQGIKAASQFQHKLIDWIYSIMSLKRKAEFDYRASLELINREIERYLIADNGFLTDIMRSYQSYITVVYQNQSSLIQGYDNEILNFLVKAKESSFEAGIMKKVQFVDEKVESCKRKIKEYKKLIKGNEEELQLISSEVTFKSKVNDLPEEDRNKMGERYNDISNLKKINEEALEQHVDGMMDLTMLHNTTVEELNEYEGVYLEQKANDVFDNFMRAFVLEVSFIRSMQFDVSNILGKVNDGKQEKRRISFEALRKRMEKERGLKGSLWDTYKKWTTPEMDVDISEHYINSRLRDKWRRVCEYYNSAAMI